MMPNHKLRKNSTTEDNDGRERRRQALNERQALTLSSSPFSFLFFSVRAREWAGQADRKKKESI